MTPFHWGYEVKQGGGFFNNLFTHMLSQIEWMTGERGCAVQGEVRRLLTHAPVGDPIHDVREGGKYAVAPQAAAHKNWRPIDADQACTVLAHLHLPAGPRASLCFQASGRAMNRQPNYIAFYGSTGTLQITTVDSYWPTQIHHYSYATQQWRKRPVPQAIVAALPTVDARVEPHWVFVQRDWNQFSREFVADVRGEGYRGYPTFHDGWRACQIIEVIRATVVAGSRLRR